MERAGTNILWNIVASHPEIVLAIKETHEIFWKFTNEKKLSGNLHIWRLLEIPFLRKLYSQRVNNILYRCKMDTMYNEDHKYKSKDTIYTKQELEKTILCLKSTNHALHFTKHFNLIFPNVYNIGIIRNGYALCSGYVRRGENSQRSGKTIQEIWGIDDQ